MKSKELEFIIKDKVKGRILSRHTEYTLSTPAIVDTVEIYTKIPHFIEVEKIIQNKAYLRASIGQGYYSVGYGRIFKGKHSLGADMVLFDSKPFVTIGYTYLLR